MIKNSYFAIAENDLEYLESVLNSGSTFYNQLAVQCQLMAEKYLKANDLAHTKWLCKYHIDSVKRSFIIRQL